MPDSDSELVTGQRPQGIFAPPSERVPVDARIDAVVVKALQQEPSRRYQQVREMQTDVAARRPHRRALREKRRARKVRARPRNPPPTRPRGSGVCRLEKGTYS